MANNSKGRAGPFGGIAAVAYALILAFCGMLLWMFIYPKVDNYADKAIEFDSKLSAELVRAGLTDADISVQSRLERSDKRAVWIEYYKEVLVPDSGAAALLGQAVTVAAQKCGLIAADTKNGHKLIITTTCGGRMLSRLSIAPGPVKPVKAKKKLAIVIDDVGGKADISAFLGLGVPVTLAIMPWERHSRDVAAQLALLKIPYIMHLPLQPEGFPKVDPGKAAILLSMNDSEVRNKFNSDLATVPGAAGVSNHMGSAYSADEDKMRLLLSLVKEHSLFYLDSYTTPKTKAGLAQKALGMPGLHSDYFLDDVDDQAAISRQLLILLAHVNRYGRGIAIGHIQKKHLAAALKDFIPKCKKAGIEFVYLTGMLE